MFTSAQFIEVIEMLKQQKTMLEEHQKLIADLQTEKDDAQKEHSNAMEGEGDLLTRKKV